MAKPPKQRTAESIRRLKESGGRKMYLTLHADEMVVMTDFQQLLFPHLTTAETFRLLVQFSLSGIADILEKRLQLAERGASNEALNAYTTEALASLRKAPAINNYEISK